MRCIIMRKAHFRCYDLETNPSISANVHILDAFRQSGWGVIIRLSRKYLRFLHANQDSRRILAG